MGWTLRHWIEENLFPHVREVHWNFQCFQLEHLFLPCAMSWKHRGAKTLELHWAKNKCFRYQQAPETGWHMMIHGMPTHQPSWIATRKGYQTWGDAAHQGNWLLRASAPMINNSPSSVGVCTQLPKQPVEHRMLPTTHGSRVCATRPPH